MNSKALFFGAALGVLAAIIPSCGSSQACSAANCRGCCQNNMCVTTNSVDATCGVNGTACDNCSAKNQKCNATSFSCIAVTGTGGMPGTGGMTAVGGMTGTGGMTATGGSTGTGGLTGTGGMIGGTACDPSTRACAGGQVCLFTNNAGDAGCFSGCDPVTNTGCTAGNTCLVSAGAGGASRQCIPQAGMAAVGAACNPMAASCVAGAVCIPGADGAGTCTKHCTSNRDCQSGFGCSLLQQVSTNELVGVCSPACDVFQQTCAMASENCVPTLTGTACIPSGQTAIGQACAIATDCVKGSLCVANKCLKICNPNGGQPGCPDGGTCGQLVAPSTMMPLGGGACL